MKFTLAHPSIIKAKSDIVAVAIVGGKLSALAQELDHTCGKALSKLLADEEFKGKLGTGRLVSMLGKVPPHILLVGLGDAKAMTLDSVRKAAATVHSYAKSVGAKSVTSELFGVGATGISKEDAAQAYVEGMTLASYQFDQFKSEKNKAKLASVALIAPKGAREASLSARMHIGAVLAEATMRARDLVNTPPGNMTPRDLAAAAKKVKGVRVRTLGMAQAKALGMGAYLAVAQGSSEAPVFIEMTYSPKKAKTILAIVGKGVTFDSGGLSLKPAKAMETMKCDMAGAAAAICFMHAVSLLKPAIEIRAYVAATENMPDGASIRPGDVVRAMNGKTIEILNTDAEGRLTLADALHYALTRKVKPTYIIDMATLTGACLVALGERCTAAMGTDQALVDKLKKAGEKSGEMIWQLPLIEEYAEEIKSPVADLQNVGGRYAGTINGGLFLKEFVGTAKWVHLDIAGSAWTDKPLPYIPKGGTGAMVRTLWELIQLLS